MPYKIVLSIQLLQRHIAITSTGSYSSICTSLPELNYIDTLDTAVSILPAFDRPHLAIGFVGRCSTKVIQALTRNKIFTLPRITICEIAIINENKFFQALSEYLPQTKNTELQLRPLPSTLFEKIVNHIFMQCDNINTLMLQIASDDIALILDHKHRLKFVIDILHKTHRSDMSLIIYIDSPYIDYQQLIELKILCSQPEQPKLTLIDSISKLPNTISKLSKIDIPEQHTYYHLHQDQENPSEYSLFKNQKNNSQSKLCSENIDDVFDFIQFVDSIKVLTITGFEIDNQFLQRLAGPCGVIDYKLELLDCRITANSPACKIKTLSFIDSPLPELKLFADMCAHIQTLVLDGYQVLDFDSLLQLYLSQKLSNSLRCIRLELDSEFIKNNQAQLMHFASKASDYIFLKTEIINTEINKNIMHELQLRHKINNALPTVNGAMPIFEFIKIFGLCNELDTCLMQRPR